MKAQELLSFKNWVVVGDVLNESKYACRILNSLKEAGFNTAGVNPRDKSGRVCKSLKEVQYNIDIVDLCINAFTGLDIVKEAHEMGINKILIQPGAESEDILDYCKNNNIIAIEGCALVELSYYKRSI